ncbi:MAG: hypothetical protein ACR2P2_00950, partial [Nakamurella sp.]
MTRATDRNADIHAVVSDDALLDRLGSGLDIFDDVPVEAILQQWRADCLLPELPAVPQGRAVRRATKWLEPDSRRSRRHRSWQAATGIAASIALLLGATTAIGARTAHPGDALWPVTELLWSDRADSVKAQQSAQQSLVEAREALAAGDLPRVRVALSSAATVLPKIESQDGHDSVQADLNAMALRLGALAPASSTAAGSSSPSIDQQDAGPATDPPIPSDNGANVAVAPSHSSVSQSAPASAATRAPAQLAPGSAAPTNSLTTPASPTQAPNTPAARIQAPAPTTAKPRPQTSDAPTIPATGRAPVAPSSATPSSAAPSSTPSTPASSTSPSESTTAPTTSGSPTSASPTAASSTAASSTAASTTSQPADPSPTAPSMPEPGQPVPSVDF